MVLFALGVLKLIGLGQEIKFFTFPDPLLSFLNNWQTSLGSALLEIGLALFLWFGWSEKWKLLTLTGTTLVFLAYRFGLYWIDYAGDCTCYGSLLGWLPDWTEPWVRASFSGLLLGMTAGCVWFNTSPRRQA